MKLFTFRSLITASVIAASSVLSTAQASTLIGSFNTGTHFDSGGCFGKWFNRGIGVGYRAANVQLAGHDMWYTSSDHHIRRSSMKISNVGYNSVSGNVSFYVSGCFHDQNGDDDLNWRAYYTIVGDKW
jgi:hypothetical protein